MYRRCWLRIYRTSSALAPCRPHRGSSTQAAATDGDMGAGADSSSQASRGSSPTCLVAAPSAASGPSLVDGVCSRISCRSDPVSSIVRDMVLVCFPVDAGAAERSSRCLARASLISSQSFRRARTVFSLPTLLCTRVSHRSSASAARSAPLLLRKRWWRVNGRVFAVRFATRLVCGSSTRGVAVVVAAAATMEEVVDVASGGDMARRAARA